MDEPTAQHDDSLPPEIRDAGCTAPRPLPAGWLSDWPMATFLLPLIVYMVLGSFDPSPPPGNAAGSAAEAVEPEPGTLAALEAEQQEGWLPQIPYRYYPLVYSLRILITVGVMIAVWPGYRTFPWKMTMGAFALSVTAGVVGVALWVGVSKLGLDKTILDGLGLGWMFDWGERSAYNPLVQLADTPVLAYGFLAIRLFGLSVVVPIIEEFFLRGFLMRFVVNDNFERVPFGYVTPLAALVGTAVPMAMHPAEWLPSLVWFTLITLLMIRTKNIWCCVIAHAVTNLLLGLYVIATGDWYFL